MLSATQSLHLALATLGLLHLLMACAALLVLRGPRHATEVRLWAAGTLALGLGIAPWGLVHGLPPVWPQVLLPGCLLASLVLRLLALRSHLGRPLQLGAVLALAGLAALAWALSLQSPDLRVRLSLGNAVLVLGTALVGWHAWEAGRRRPAPTARWLALTEWTLTAVLVACALAIPAVVPASGPLPVGWAWLLPVMVAALAALYGHLAYLGMAMDQVHRAERQARQAQIDATASREAAEQTALELQMLLQQRDALAAERERLLTLLAHDIRQPLASASEAMQQAVRVLRDPHTVLRPGDPKIGERLQAAQSVLGEVRSVLDNTLATATLLSREAPLARQEVALDFLIELTLGDLAPHQLARLTVDWCTEQQMLEVEPGLVRLALRNLLANAFTHGGPAAQVQLRVDDAPADRTVQVTVTDDGPGITPQQLPDARLSRHDLAPEADDEGDPDGGQSERRRLGLAVARQVMELHGGRLELSNALPRGCVATLVFPLPADDWGLDANLARQIDAGLDAGPDTRTPEFEDSLAEAGRPAERLQPRGDRATP